MSEKQNIQIVYEGRLVMETSSNQWKSRYCRLFQNKFEYYSNQKVNFIIFLIFKDEQPLGRIPIYAKLEYGVSSDKGLKNCFKISTLTRKYFFTCENGNILNEWIQNLKILLNKKNTEPILTPKDLPTKKVLKWEKQMKKSKTEKDTLSEESLKLFPELASEIKECSEFIKSSSNYPYPKKFECSIEEFNVISVFLEGSIYLFENFFCFYSKVLSKVTRFYWYFDLFSSFNFFDGNFKFKTREEEEFCLAKFKNEEFQNEIKSKLSDEIEQDFPLIDVMDLQPSEGIDMKKNFDSDEEEEEVVDQKKNLHEDSEEEEEENEEKKKIDEDDDEIIVRKNLPIIQINSPLSNLTKELKKEKKNNGNFKDANFQLKKLFLKAYESETKKTFPNEEIVYLSLYSLYNSDLYNSKLLYGNLYLTQGHFWFCGFKPGDKKPYLWFIQFEFISEITVMQYDENLDDYILQIRMFDGSNHWIIFEKKKDLFEKIDLITNIVKINIFKIEDVKKKKIKRALMIINEIYSAYLTQRSIDTIVIESANKLLEITLEKKIIEASEKMTPRKSIVVDSHYFDQVIINESDLGKVLDLIRDPKKGIEIKDCKKDGIVYERCFSGRDFVTWILQNLKNLKTRTEASSYGQELVEQGVIKHVLKNQPFKDSDDLYFLVSTKKSSMDMKDPSTSATLGASFFTTLFTRKSMVNPNTVSNQTQIILQTFELKKKSWFGTSGDLVLYVKQDVSQNGIFFLELFQNGVTKDKISAKEIKEIDPMEEDNTFYILFENGKKWIFETNQREECMKFLNEIYQQVNNYQV